MTIKLFKKREDSEIRAAWLIEVYGLKMDPKVPNRYWLDDQKYIMLIHKDPTNVREAEIAIRAHYAKPVIEDATPDQMEDIKKAPKKKSFLNIDPNSPVMKGFEEVGNNVMKNLPAMGSDMAGVGQGAMRSGVKNANQMSGMDGDINLNVEKMNREFAAGGGPNVQRNIEKMNRKSSSLEDMGLRHPDAGTDFLGIGGKKNVTKKKPPVKRATKKAPVKK